MDYEQKKQGELNHYAHVESLDPALLHDSLKYWSEKWAPIMSAAGLDDDSHFTQTLERCRSRSSVVNVISFGTGSCDNEIALANRLLGEGVTNFHIECLEFNPILCERVRETLQAQRLGQYITVTTQDINSWVPVRSYDVVIAMWCLHHFVELEHIFDQIHKCLTDDGVFITAEAIGRNGHVRWPEVWPILQPLWDNIPDKYKFNHQLGTWDIDRPWDDDCASGSFEGVRAQDILPLLIERFRFHNFAPFASLAEKFFEKNYGPNYDVTQDEDRAIIDKVAALDELLIDLGIIKPCRVSMVMGKKSVAKPKYYKHWTPEFVVRWPDGRRSITPLEAMESLRASEYTSVIFVVQNELQDVLQAIESVLKNCVSESEIEVIVVDNGSVDGTSTTLQNIGGLVRCIRIETPVSNIDAWQAGISAATMPFVALLGADIRVEHGWDNPLRDAAMQSSIAATPTIVDASGQQREAAGLDQTSGVCMVVAAEALRSGDLTGVEVIGKAVVQSVAKPHALV